VTPTSTPFSVDRPDGYNHFFSAAAVDGQGNTDFVYTGVGANGSYNVYLRRFDNQSTPLGSPTQVNTTSSGDHIPGAIAAAPDGRFVIVWYGDGPNADGSDIWAERFNADGTPADSAEWQVNQFTAGLQTAPAVSIDSNGNIAVVWTDEGQDPNQQPHSYGRLFSWDLTSNSDDFPLEAASLSLPWSESPRVSIGADGSFVASYLANSGTDAAVGYLQQFSYVVDDAGKDVSAVGDPIQPDPEGWGDLAVTPVAAADGSFTAIVDRAPNGTQSDSIGLRHYDASGQPLESALVPVTTMQGQRFTNGAGLDGGGNLWVSWHDGATDGSWDLYARRFQPDGTPITDAIRITPTTEPLDWGAKQSIAVGQDGSMTAGWTTYSASSGYGVEARHYDPVLFTDANSSTWSGSIFSCDNIYFDYRNQHISVTAHATGFADHILWEYWVKNINYTGLHGTGLGQFSLYDALAAYADVTNSMGWTLQDRQVVGYDTVMWKAENGSFLTAGHEAYFSYTTGVLGIGQTQAYADDLENQYPDGVWQTDANLLPLAPVVDRFSISVPKYVPVNADNDNYEPWNVEEGIPENHPCWASVDGVVQPGIPFQRDFNATHLWKDDPDLKPITISWPANDGTVSFTVTSTGGTGRIRFWKEQTKDHEFTNADLANNHTGTATFFVEGAHESDRVDDFTVTVTWTSQTGIVEVKKGTVTVTPIITKFTATPAPSPNITFNYNWLHGGLLGEQNVPPTGYMGLNAHGVDPNDPTKKVPGIAFSAEVITGGQFWTVEYVQDLMKIENGVNSGTGKGVTFKDNRFPPEFFGPTPGSGLHIPGLDTHRNDSIFYSDYLGPDPNGTTQPIANGVRIQSTDIPSTGAASYGGAVALDDCKWVNLIDMRETFRTYVAVGYSDGSIWSIAYHDWWANFYADTWAQDRGPTQIEDPNGVKRLTATFVRSNQNPWTAGPIVLGNLTWQRFN
jgi:hypothetical protein